MAGQRTDGHGLSTGQAARCLGISCVTLLRAIRRGESVAAYRIPKGGGRFDAAAIRAAATRLTPQGLNHVSTSRSRHSTHTRRFDRRAASDRVRALYATMACGVLVLTADGVVSDVNDAARRILGLAATEIGDHVLGQALAHTVRADGSDLPVDERPIQRALRTGQPQRDAIVGITRLDGEQRWLHVDAVPLRDPDGTPREVVVSFTDITARKRGEEALRRQALHDDLTGLPNRTLLYDRLEQSLHGAARAAGAAQPLALLLLDLNRFKDINDTFGHQAGDALLQQVAARLQGMLRAGDTVARLGGDEFAVLLAGADAGGACQVAQTLQAALEEPIPIAGQPILVGSSIGVAVAPAHGDDATSLLRCADVAMYVAKRTNAGSAVYDARLDQHCPDRLALVADLRQAIAHDELALYYQPIVTLETGHVSGVEVLLRWPHPLRGLLPPDVFIPVAEQTGLIGSLTQWVLEAALRQCQTWQRAGLTLAVAVNLSMGNLRDPGLPASVEALLQRHGLTADQLRLELTETSLMADSARGLEVLRCLSAVGVGLSVDDYGTGYSSLAYLKRLPVDELKIDRSFVQQMAVDATDAAIVASTVGLGHSLGLRVVAEGVEDRETAEQLTALGCDLAQGYYWSQPMPAEDVTRLLHDAAAAGGVPV